MSGGFLTAVISTPPPDDGGWLDWLDPTEWVEKAGTGILSQIAEGVGEAAASLLSGIWGAIAETTTPQVDAAFLREWFGRVFAISLPITVGFMALQVILTVLRTRGAAGLGRAVWGAGVAVLGTFVAVPVVALLVAAVDGLAMDLAAITSGDLETLIGQVTALLLGDNPTDGAHMVGGGLVGTVGAIILGFLAVVGAIAVWMALLIRAMLLYVVVVIAPICFAGLVWEPTRAWFRRWLTMIVALVFTKLGVVLVFGVGVSAVGTAGQGTGIGAQLAQLFSGLVMLAMASLVPIACFKFFSFLGDESVQALHSGAAGGAARGTDAVRGMASKPMDALRRQSSGPGGGGSGGGSAGGQQRKAQGGSSAAQLKAGGQSSAGPAGGAPTSGWSGASGGGAGVGAAGGVAAGAGALVGAGVAAGGKAAEAGRAGAGQADAHREQAASGSGGAAPAATKEHQDRGSRQSEGRGRPSRPEPSADRARGAPPSSPAPARGGGGGAAKARPAGGATGGVKTPPVGKP